jgi:hypothetical protein
MKTNALVGALVMLAVMAFDVSAAHAQGGSDATATSAASASTAKHKKTKKPKRTPNAKAAADSISPGGASDTGKGGQ